MCTPGRFYFGLFLLVVGLGAGQVCAQTRPAETAPATAPVRKTVQELLPTQAAAFSFTNAPITDVLAYLSKSYGVTLINDHELKGVLTILPPDPVPAKEAIAIVNDSLLPLGYTLLSTVKGDPPQVVLTVVPTTRDPGSAVPVYVGSNPAKIPEGDEIRTQVMQLTYLDPAKAKEFIAPALGPKADVTVNGSTKTIIVTDSATHIHMAATLIEALEKQAGDNKKSADGKTQ